jgi:predicted AAA+ superfamily ATPase
MPKWVRGGFPESLLAEDDSRSLIWRQDSIRTYLERDIPQLGSRMPPGAVPLFYRTAAGA